MSVDEVRQLKQSLLQMKERAHSDEREKQALRERLENVENIANERQCQLDELKQKGQSVRADVENSCENMALGRVSKKPINSVPLGSPVKAGPRQGRGLGRSSDTPSSRGSLDAASTPIDAESITAPRSRRQRESKAPSRARTNDVGQLLDEFRRLRERSKAPSRQKVWPSDA